MANQKRQLMRLIVEELLFSSKWLLIPFYLILVIALGLYAYFDITYFISYLMDLKHVDKSSAMLMLIELIDIAMVAGLAKMIITGSYNSFVNKSNESSTENMSSGMLKVKMATSLIGITSITILEESIEIKGVDWDTLYKLAFVHIVFLFSAIILSIVDYLHEKTKIH